MRSATSATGPSPGTAVPSRSSAPSPTSTPAAASTAPSRSVGAAVRDLLVHRPPLLVQSPKPRLVARERPVAPRDALPANVDRGVEEQRERGRTKRLPRPRGAERAAAELDYRELAASEHVVGRLLLERPKGRLAVLLEDLRDRAPAPVLDDVVDANERASEPLGELRAKCGLARAHEADERDVPVERGQGVVSGSMRAR